LDEDLRVIVMTPILVEDAPRRLHPLVKLGSGIRRRREQLDDRDLVLPEELDRPREDAGVLAVEADHDERDHLDAALAQLLEVLGVAARTVEALLQAFEDRCVDALETDRERDAAR